MAANAAWFARKFGLRPGRVGLNLGVGGVDIPAPGRDRWSGVALDQTGRTTLDGDQTLVVAALADLGGRRDPVVLNHLVDARSSTSPSATPSAGARCCA